MSLNGKTCWTKTGLYGRSGTRNECGGSANRLLYRRVFLEERFPVTGCFATLEANMPLTVRVWTNLDSHSRDESFAIDNVVIRLLAKGNACLFSTLKIILLYSMLPVYFYYRQQVLQSLSRRFMINKTSRDGTAIRSPHVATLEKFAEVMVSRARERRSRRPSTCLRVYTRCNSTSSKSILGSCVCLCVCNCVCVCVCVCV